MSTADADEVVEVSEGGVTVRKTFAPDEFPVPAIRFAFDQIHDETVEVRLSEDIPESFPMDGIGFHPDYHSESWTAYEDHRVEFTGTVPADEEFVTVYGIRIDDDTDIDGFLTEPTIVQVETDGADVDSDDDDAVDDNTMDDIVGDGNDAVKDMLSGESDSVPGLEDDEEDTEEDLDLDLDVDDEDEEEEEAEIELNLNDEEEDEGEAQEEEEPELELDIDDNEDEETAEAEDEDEPAEESADEDTAEEPSSPTSPEKPDGPTGITQETSVPEPSPEPVGERLVEEIQAGKLSDGDLEVLREELEIEEPGVELAKVDHLQSRVEELSAYAGALEEFLEEEGTGAQLIEEFRGELEAVETRLEETDDRIGGVEGGLNTLEDQTNSLGTAIEETNEYVEGVEGMVEDVDSKVDDHVASLEETIEGVETDVAELETEVESLDDAVTDIVDWRSELGSMFQGD